MASKLNVISSALTLIGDLPLTSLSGTTRAHVVADSLYDNTVQMELSKFRWSFARKKAQLSLVAATPVGNEYDHMYQLPSDMMFLIKLNPSINYQVINGQVYCNYSGSLFCDYSANVAESEWPAYFAKMVEYKLAMDFAPSIRDSAGSMELMAAQYEIASRMARYTDSQQSPITPLQSRPFIDVRF